MKLRPDIFKITLNFLIWTLVIGILFFVAFIKIFVFSSWGVAQWVMIGVFLFLVIVLYLAMYFSTYYEIEDKSFTYKCLGKEQIFDYDKIHFIDARKGKDTKTLGIYLSATTVKYLTNDRKGELYETLMERCKQLYDETYIKK